MSKYRIRLDGKIVTENELRELFPNKMLPQVLSNIDTHLLGVDPVLAGVYPSVGDFESLIEGPVQQDSLGNWVTTWVIVPWAQPQKNDFITTSKVSVWESIKNERSRRTLETGILVNGKWFQTDLVSRTQYITLSMKATNLILTGSLPTDIIQTTSGPVLWKTMDNSFVPITIQLIRDIVTDLENQEAAVFKQAETHKAIMEASPDPTKYNFLTGWPPTFN